MFSIGKSSCVVVSALSLLAVSWATPIGAQSKADQVIKKLVDQGSWRLTSTDKHLDEAKIRLSFKNDGGLKVSIKRSRIKSQTVKVDDDGNVTIKLVRSQRCGPRNYEYSLKTQTKTGFKGYGTRDKKRCGVGTSDVIVTLEPN